MSVVDAIIKEIEEEFPDFKIIPKRRSEFMGFLDVCLRIITFGKMSEFMKSYTTTIGYTIYVPEGWGNRSARSRATTLRHERVHMRQRRKYGFFLFTFLYLLCAPTLFAYWRTKFEKEAYEESMRATVEYYGAAMLIAIKGSMVDHFLTADYFWMWPFRKSVEAWYDKTADKVIAEFAQP